jgi:exosortase K
VAAAGRAVREGSGVTAFVRAQRWQIDRLSATLRVAARSGRAGPCAALVAVLALVVAGKLHYSAASPGELRWILAPTAGMVSAVTGGNFAYEAGVGWVDREATFIIAPACAGVNFALAAFLALTLGWLAGMRTWRAAALRLAVAAALAYGATLIVNTLRIALAIALHRGAIDLRGLDRAEVHRAEGILVYLCGLCALYALAGALERRSHALPR